MSDTPTRPAAANPAARAAAVAAAAAARAAPDWDLVLKRNNVERLKREKFPLEIVNELEELGQKNYLDIAEEDMVRFQWYGLYQDKPKVGYFMLRIKAPSGIMTAAQYRAIGELSQKFGRDYTELSTRQNVQLHWLQIKDFPEVFAAMEAVGLTSLGGCGDSVRNITGCPVAGLDAEELWDCRPELDQVVQYFLSDRDYFDLPRKHKITISTCTAQCNAPEINCIVFIGTQQDGREGYSLRVGGGLSSTPRLARDLNVFVPRGEALEVSKAILDVWRTDLRYRLSRAKAIEKMQVFMDKLERHYGKRPVIYTAPDFYRDNLTGEFKDYPFWLRSVAAHPSQVYPGRKWLFWQYSGSGLSHGVEGRIDLNVFRGSEADWHDWVARN